MPHDRATDRLIAFLVALALISTGVIGCGRSSDSGRSDPGSETGDLTVFAAASLTEAFTEIGRQYETKNRGAEVTFNFASSSDLAAQIDQGAPADTFASADELNMQKVTAAGMADGEPTYFAGNVLEIAVPKGNPGNVQSLDDFARKDLIFAICVVEAPCGSAAIEVFQEAGVDPAIDSFEADVKSVLTKIEIDEVDAGLVYHSDVVAAEGKIESIKIPRRNQVVNRYPIVVVKGAGNPQGGRDFIHLVMSSAGQAELSNRGLRAP